MGFVRRDQDKIICYYFNEVSLDGSDGLAQYARRDLRCCDH